MDIIPGSRRRQRGKGGKKNRKHGREKTDPAHIRYNLERRWKKNKKRRIEKEAKRQARLKKRKLERQQPRNPT